jgi:hypothetical protein
MWQAQPVIIITKYVKGQPCLSILDVTKFIRGFTSCKRQPPPASDLIHLLGYTSSFSPHFELIFIMKLRSSSRHAGDHVTAAAGIVIPKSKSTVQPSTTGRSRSKKTIVTRMKTSIKNKPTGSKTSFKRKGQPENVGHETTKRSRTEDDELLEEVSQLLEPVRFRLDVIIEAFPQYQHEKWYQALETRKVLISNLHLEVESRDGLSMRPELSSFSREGLPFTLPEADRDKSDYALVQVKLDDLEISFRKAIAQLQVHDAPAPSTYCLRSAYKDCQLDSHMAVRDGRTGTVPVALELLHISFRTFTYWSFLNPYPLPGSPAWKKEKRLIDEDKDAFIKVYQAANQLLFSMPHFYDTHDDRLFDFKKALQLIFPEDGDFEWSHSAPADQGLSNVSNKYKIDIVYRNKETSIPLIFAEVKLELGEGGNPFWQNHRLYQSYTKSNPESRRNGAPVFLIQLCGMTFLYHDFHIS